MPRSYVQRTRAETARQTRAEVLAAAREAILGDGRLEFSVGDIADRAGVARSTVYAAFGSRAGLLSALADETLHRAGLEAVLAAYAQEDAVDALEASLRASCRMYAADHRVISRLLVLSEIDPDAAVPLSRSQTDRRAGLGFLAARIAAQGRLRAGVSIDQAADTLSVITGFWAYDELATGRRLDVEACADRLIEMARGLVIAPPATPRRRASPDRVGGERSGGLP